MVGYSSTPLWKKLGLKPGGQLHLLDAPAGFAIPDLPAGVSVRRARGTAKAAATSHPPAGETTNLGHPPAAKDTATSHPPETEDTNLGHPSDGKAAATSHPPAGEATNLGHPPAAKDTATSHPPETEDTNLGHPSDAEDTATSQPPVGETTAPEHPRAGEATSVVLAFFTALAQLEARIEPLSRAVFPDGALWVAWPRRAAGHDSDVREQDIRGVALALGLVDVKVAALAEDWSGLRLVWRRELRHARGAGPG